MDMNKETFTKLINPIVIIINGFPQSGKDTFCDIASKYYSTINYSTVDTIKYIATLMGWNGEKDPKSRAMLSALKDFATEYFDLSYNEMTNIILNDNETKKNDFIFLHIREPKEINLMVDWCLFNKINCYTLCIERNAVNHLKQSNHADSCIHDIIYDIYISNNGTTEDFDKNISLLLRNIYLGDLSKWRYIKN